MKATQADQNSPTRRIDNPLDLDIGWFQNDSVSAQINNPGVGLKNIASEIQMCRLAGE